MSLPKHKYLLTYRYAEIIQDGTVEFCQSFLSNLRNLGRLSQIPTRRTIEQMTQAARSGKQNIVEGVGQSETSKKGEIKLLGVAKASFEELLADFEDFLRQRNLAIWPKSDKKVMSCRQVGFRLSHLSNLSDLGNLKEKLVLPKDQAEAANLMLTLIHQETFLLDRQIKALERRFVEKGGFTENLFKNRIKYRHQPL